MGTILKIKNIKINIIPGDHRPAHVHVIAPDAKAKIGLENGECYYARGFSKKDIRQLENIVKTYQEFLLETWEIINEKEKNK